MHWLRVLARVGLAMTGAAFVATSAGAAPSAGGSPAGIDHTAMLDSLKHYCVDTDADADATLKLAAADGFEAVADPDDATAVDVEDGHAVRDRAQNLNVAVGRMVAPKKIRGYRLAVCVLIKPEPDNGALRRQVRRWLGFDAFEHDPRGDTYFFDRGPNSWRSLEMASDDELRSLAAQGRVHLLLAAGSASGNTILVYGTMVPEAPAAPAAPDTAAAPATTPFDDFKTVCVPHHGSAAEALKAAEDAGWMVTPESVGPGLPYPLVSGDFRIKSTAEDLEVVVAGEAHYQLNLQHLSFSMCGVMQAPPADRTLLEAVKAWVGVEPVDTFPGGSEIYLFVDEAGKHRSLGGPKMDTDLARAARRGTPVTVVILDQGRSLEAEAFVAIGSIDKVTAVDAGTAAYAQR